MVLLAVSISLFLFTVIIMLFHNKGIEVDNKNRRLNKIKKGDNSWDEEFEKPFLQRVIIPIYTSGIKTISTRLFRKSTNRNEKMERQLLHAGLYLSVADYNAARLTLFGVLFLGALIPVFLIRSNPALKLLILLIAGLISLIGPVLFLRIRIRKRQTAISKELPDIIDLLCVTMEAGLGFDSALVKISEGLSGVLVSELNIVHNEINYGKPRREALRSLSERNDVEELKNFAGVIIQAEQLGIPINQVLKAQSEEVRIKRKQNAEEKAMKAPVKMAIPLVLFVLPVLFIALLGPTILQLLQELG